MVWVDSKGWSKGVMGVTPPMPVLTSANIKREANMVISGVAAKPNGFQPNPVAV